MFNLKKDECDEKVSNAGLNIKEEMLFRYTSHYGHSGTVYKDLTPKKNHPLLDVFEYVLPEEFELFKKNIKEPNKEEKEILYKYYIGTKRSWILNTKLRKGQELTSQEQKVFNILKNICYENRCGKNCILKRFVDLNFLSQYDITFDKYDENSARNALKKIKNNLVYNTDIVRIEKGFMSASYEKNGFSDREVLLLLYTPCGIRMYVTDNDAETEVIFLNGMRYYFVDAYLEQVTYCDIKYYRIVLCCLMLGEK